MLLTALGLLLVSLSNWRADAPAAAVPGASGVMALLCGASDRPLSRDEIRTLLALRPEMPPPRWDGKLHTAVKPPRPERPEYVELVESRVYRYNDRLRVKSGITGWAQIH